MSLAMISFVFRLILAKARACMPWAAQVLSEYKLFIGLGHRSLGL